MYAVKFLALAIAITTAASLGACSKAESLGANSTVAAAQQGSVSNVSNAELQTLLDQKVTLVDIRLPEEWQQTGIVAGSHPITLFQKDGSVAADFLAKIQKVAPTDKPVALICRTGNRTRAGADMLAQVGYKQVYNVTNGIMGWIKEGKAVVRQ
ncbi:MAG: rhodanese-like domain-containing protein [Candidatus Thiothrix putei]|uniref:Rhodanese-like domain-containing protein n=1 Tax=Candidatus Thiothrix putei TaxID=3080811 RepID=A0AA95HFB3_9GAMM|nr:MAG: rhodanese-like domain-containing protein [Candidatus Thiothrix putei]